MTEFNVNLDQTSMSSPLQQYWNNEANPIISSVDWKHLGLRLLDEK